MFQTFQKLLRFVCYQNISWHFIRFAFNKPVFPLPLIFSDKNAYMSSSYLAFYLALKHVLKYFCKNHLYSDIHCLYDNFAEINHFWFLLSEQILL